MLSIFFIQYSIQNTDKIVPNIGKTIKDNLYNLFSTTLFYNISLANYLHKVTHCHNKCVLLFHKIF